MAKTTGVINGTDVIVAVGSMTFGYSRSCSISRQRDMRDVSNKDSSGNKEVLPGQASWSAEVEGLVVFAAATGGNMAYLDNLITAKTKVTLKFKTAASADYYWQGDAYLASVNYDMPNQDNTTYAAQFTGTGPLSLIDPESP